EEQGAKVFVVSGQKIEKFARRTRFDTYEGLRRLRDIMKKMGITHALIRAGAVGDSIIRIGDDQLTLVEQE
ncbi:MAG TPA: Obg family GTPase CgtA, partial [Candidatus Saccharibacteria bacterium]|nr:Obg family GTPase CgtA [Candidatus Saccharibacteria bacterium]